MSTWSDPMPAVMASFESAPGDAFLGQVGRPERLEITTSASGNSGRNGVRSLLVRRDHQGVPGGFEVVSKAERS